MPVPPQPLPPQPSSPPQPSINFAHKPSVAVFLFCLLNLIPKPTLAVDYLTDIKPLLEEKCWSCHGVLKQESGLRLDTRAQIIEAGIVLPGDPSDSELISRIIAASSERMPPPSDGSKLTEHEIDLLRTWIGEGAMGPEDEPIPVGPDQHWAFQPILQRPTEKGSIDEILDSIRVQRNVTTVRPADRPIAIRRLYIDLVGLPPSTEQLNDVRPWEQIVDSLLTSPQHGERWGRHWMDIWRYSDWYGLGEQLRNSQKHLWHWRDWIVESINADKGYDQMILEMIAGDELAPEDDKVVRATGFLARNYYLFNRTTWLDSTVEHTGKAFLGLTLNCAKCHDHKYDPISHIDYYQFRAFFEPHQIRLDPVPGQTNLDVDGLPRAFDDHLDAETKLHLRGDPANPDPNIDIVPAVPAILNAYFTAPEAKQLPPYAYAPITRPHVQSTLLDEAQRKIEQAEADLAAQQSQSEGTTDSLQLARLEAALVLARAQHEALAGTLNAENILYKTSDNATAKTSPEYTAAANQAAILQAKADVALADFERILAGEASDKLAAAEAKLQRANERLAQASAGAIEYQPPRVARKALETPAHNFETYATSFSSTSSGRRTALARWIADRRNPLTARVAVNHVWLRHFNQPLVESMFDFGLQAKRPEQAELLDFLAWELMESGWSFKHLHRLIVTSRAYQLSSSAQAASPETIKNDPNNLTYWRMNGRRLESQTVRDSLLMLAGELELDMGGPSLDPGPNVRRRSIYFKHSRDQQDLFLATFDDADHLQCYRRTESIVPQQALALANSKLSLTMAERIAQRLSHDLASSPKTAERESLPSLDAFIDAAFTLLLARLPDQREKAECQAYCESLRELPTIKQQAQPEQRIQARLVHVLINHNDFVTVR